MLQVLYRGGLDDVVPSISSTYVIIILLHQPTTAYHIRSSWSIIKLRGDTFSLQKFVKYQIPLLRSTTPAHKKYEKAQVDGKLLKAYVPTTPSSYLILTRTFGGGPIFA